MCKHKVVLLTLLLLLLATVAHANFGEGIEFYWTLFSSPNPITPQPIREPPPGLT